MVAGLDLLAYPRPGQSFGELIPGQPGTRARGRLVWSHQGLQMSPDSPLQPLLLSLLPDTMLTAWKIGKEQRAIQNE